MHVLTRGDERDARRAGDARGVHVHRVREPRKPRDLDEFVAWVEQMNADMLAAGRELARGLDFDLVHGHDWLVADAGDAAGRARSAARGSRRSTRPSTAATRAGSTSTRSRTSTASRRGWRTRADAVIICSHYMRDHVADIYGLDERARRGDPERDRPASTCSRSRTSTRCAPASPQPHERLVLLVGRLVYEKGFQIALEALPGVIERLGDVRFLVAGSGTAEAELRAQADALGLARARHVPRLDRRRRAALALPHRRPDAWCRRSTSRSGSSRWRRWPPAARASSPTPAACARSCRTSTSACASASRDPRSLAAMMERVLSDDALRERLVAEASEHVLRFDWADIARQTAEVYGELAARSARRAVRIGRAGRAAAADGPPRRV